MLQVAPSNYRRHAACLRDPSKRSARTIRDDALMPEIELAEDAYHAARGADAVAIVTEWDVFRALDLKRLGAGMAAPVMVDLRNIYPPVEAERAGFRYSSIGR